MENYKPFTVTSGIAPYDYTEVLRIASTPQFQALVSRARQELPRGNMAQLFREVRKTASFQAMVKALSTAKSAKTQGSYMSTTPVDALVKVTSKSTPDAVTVKTDSFKKAVRMFPLAGTFNVSKDYKLEPTVTRRMKIKPFIERTDCEAGILFANYPTTRTDLRWPSLTLSVDHEYMVKMGTAERTDGGFIVRVAGEDYFEGVVDIVQKPQQQAEHVRLHYEVPIVSVELMQPRKSTYAIEKKLPPKIKHLTPSDIRLVETQQYKISPKYDGELKYLHITAQQKYEILSPNYVVRDGQFFLHVEQVGVVRGNNAHDLWLEMEDAGHIKLLVRLLEMDGLQLPYNESDLAKIEVLPSWLIRNNAEHVTPAPVSADGVSTIYSIMAQKARDTYSVGSDGVIYHWHKPWYTQSYAKHTPTHDLDYTQASHIDELVDEFNGIREFSYDGKLHFIKDRDKTITDTEAEFLNKERASAIMQIATGDYRPSRLSVITRSASLYSSAETALLRRRPTSEDSELEAAEVEGLGLDTLKYLTGHTVRKTYQAKVKGASYGWTVFFGDKLKINGRTYAAMDPATYTAIHQSTEYKVGIVNTPTPETQVAVGRKIRNLLGNRLRTQSDLKCITRFATRNPLPADQDFELPIVSTRGEEPGVILYDPNLTPEREHTIEMDWHDPWNQNTKVGLVHVIQEDSEYEEDWSEDDEEQEESILLQMSGM